MFIDYDFIIVGADKTLFNKLRLTCRNSIKSKYDREVYWHLLLKEYKDLIN